MNSEVERLKIFSGIFPARSETFVKSHVCGMARRGWDVTCLAANADPELIPEDYYLLNECKITKRYWGAYSDKRLRRAAQLLYDLAKNPTLFRYLGGSGPWTRPEMFTAHRMKEFGARTLSPVTHIHFGKYAALLAEIGWDQPSVVTWHGFDANMLPKMRGTKIYQGLFQKNWFHTVGSTFMRDRLEDLGANRAKIYKVPMGIDFGTFRYLDRSQRSSDTCSIISVGRLDHVKGHHVLIDAIAEAKRRNFRVRAKIVGEGKLRGQLEQKIRELGLTGTVELLGAQTSSRVLEELHLADLFVLSGVVAADGSEEAQGLAYIEAQATGLPVIASAIGGVSESLLPQQSGLLTRQGDTEGVAEAITFYATNREIRLTHGLTGANFVRSKFDLEKMLDAFERIYMRVRKDFRS